MAETIRCPFCNRENDSAMDAAIVRYRIERRYLAINMESTRTRMLEDAQ